MVVGGMGVSFGVVEDWVVKWVVWSSGWLFIDLLWLWVPLYIWVVIADEIGVFDSWINFFALWSGVVCWADGLVIWVVEWVASAFWAADASLLTEVVSEFKVRIFRVWVFLKLWKVLTVVRELIESVVGSPSKLAVCVCVWGNFISLGLADEVAEWVATSWLILCLED